LWAMAIRAPGAVGIRLRIRPWSPPVGAELVMYDAVNPGYSHGPFTRSHRKKSNEFWTPTVYSQEVRVEYYLPPGINYQAPESQVAIDGLLNQYRSLPTGGKVPVVLPCHLDVTCYPDWNNEKDAWGAFRCGQPIWLFLLRRILNRVPLDFTPFL